MTKEKSITVQDAQRLYLFFFVLGDDTIFLYGEGVTTTAAGTTAASTTNTSLRVKNVISRTCAVAPRNAQKHVRVELDVVQKFEGLTLSELKLYPSTSPRLN